MSTLRIIYYKIFIVMYVTAVLFHGRKHATIVNRCWHWIHSLTWWIVHVRILPFGRFSICTRLLFELCHL